MCRSAFAAVAAVAAAISLFSHAGVLGEAATNTSGGPSALHEAPLSPKVLILSFDPIIEAEGGRRLSKVCGWNDALKLAEDYRRDLKESSGDFVDYAIVRTTIADEYPVKKDGFRYTDESYMKCFQTSKGWHQPDGIDYRAIIEKYKLADLVGKGEIDEIWMFGAPYFGYWESTMAGKGAYFCNSAPVEGVDCSRIFVIMGFNYERGVGEMLEDFGHRTESIVRRVYGSWEHNEKHAWNRFTLYDKVAPGKAACGNVHFAPNSVNDYDWGNETYVWSTCDDWLSYPDLTGKKRKVNCSEWGNGNIREHHKWWLKHLPRAPGRSDGKLSNWWKYVVDFNAYPESR
jgi:hypothetical protein